MKKVILSLLIITLFLSLSIANAETLTGSFGDIQYVSDTKTGYTIAHSCAVALINKKLDLFQKIFVTNDCVMALYLNEMGEKIFNLAPRKYKKILRDFVKVLRKNTGNTAVTVYLKESDGTTVAKAKTGVFSSKIDVEFY